MQRFWSALLENVQEGFGATLYHYERMLHIERAIFEAAVVLKDLPANATAFTGGGGNLRVLHYEYQGYLMAYRRTLEYLGGAVSAYFKCETKSIRDVREQIDRRPPLSTSENIKSILEIHLRGMADVLPPDRSTRSARDVAAHRNPVYVGCFNVQFSPDEVRILFCPAPGEPAAPAIPEVIHTGTRKVVGFRSIEAAFAPQLKRLEDLVSAVAAALVPSVAVES